MMSFFLYWIPPRTWVGGVAMYISIVTDFKTLPTSVEMPRDKGAIELRSTGDRVGITLAS